MTDDLHDEALGLKELDRAGWLRAGIAQPESVAAHSWGVAWLALLTCPEGLDRDRVVAMAVLHDLPEVRVGDITPADGVDRRDKEAAEDAAARDLFAGRPDLLELWSDYAEQRTAEARFVRDLDRLDMGLQALRYARRTGADTAEFVASALREMSDPRLRALLETERE